MSSLPCFLNVSFIQESSCSLLSKDFFYYQHNITTPYTFTPSSNQNLKMASKHSLGVPIWEGDHKCPQVRLAPLMTTLSVHSLFPPTFSILIFNPKLGVDSGNSGVAATAATYTPDQVTTNLSTAFRRGDRRYRTLGRAASSPIRHDCRHEA